MTEAGEGRRPRRLGWRLLVAAWLLLALILIAAAAYLFVVPNLRQADGGPPGAAGQLTSTAPASKVDPPAEEPSLAAVLGGPLASADVATEPSPATAAAPPTWQAFAHPFDDPAKRPRIAVIVSDLGLSAAATQAVMARLPPDVALSFNPYGTRLAEWIAQARAAGYEVLMDLPLEPVSPVEGDPGPKGLRTQFDAARNRERLDWVLAQGSDLVGVVASLGSRFLASRRDLAPVMATLGARGLIFVDNAAADADMAADLARESAVSIVFSGPPIDDKLASQAAIDARLAGIERLARDRGVAVVLARPLPISLERLQLWIATLEGKGFVLAPVSAATLQAAQSD